MSNSMTMMRRLRHKLGADHGAVTKAVVSSAEVTGAELPIDRCRDRSRVTVAGVLQSVSDHRDFLAVQARLVDESGESVTVIWLGRRAISGVATGRRIAIFGRIGVRDGERVMFNPAYELRD